MDRSFRGWNDIWLDSAFRNWNIEDYLPRMQCPVLAMQGYEDEYGTMIQLDRIAHLAPKVELLKLSECRHFPRRDQAEAVVTATVNFINRL